MNEIAKCPICGGVPSVGKYVLHSDYASLLARNSALVEAVDNLKDHNQYLEACLEDRNAEMMRHVRMCEGLVEAVAWERECISAEIIWKDRNESSYQEWIGTVHAARAEVDRLIADCEGEG